MLTQLSRRDWPHFFARLSAALAARPASVDTSGLEEDLLHSMELVDADERRDFVVLHRPVQVLL